MSNLIAIYDGCEAKYRDNYRLITLCVDETIIKMNIKASEREIKALIDNLEDRVNEFDADFQAEVNSSINNITSGAESNVNTIITRSGGIINNTLDSTNAYINQSYDFLTTSAEESVRQVTEITSDAVKNINMISDEAVGNANRVTQKVEEGIDDIFYKMNQNVEILSGDAETGIAETLWRSLEAINTASDIVYGGIKNSISETTEFINNQIEVATGDLNLLSQSLINDTAYLVEAINQDIKAGKEQTASFIDTLTGDFLKHLKSIGEFFSDLVKGTPPKRMTEQVKDDVNEWQAIMEIISTTANNPKDIERVINKHKSKFGWWGNVVLTMLHSGGVLFFIMSIMSMVNTSRSEIMRQNVLKDSPVNIFSFPELISIFNRGFSSEEFARDEALKSGFDSNHFNMAYKTNETPIDIERASNALFRGLINENTFKSYLKRQGYNKNDINILRSVADVRPSVQDLITMSVREVFDRDFVEQFQLFSDLPEDFVIEAQKSGLSRDWAVKYWGAHWSLPSANQGFEMFHRGVIDEDTLKLLLRALDVSPYWRDKLKEIAYNPITRIDIRRMYALGLLSEDDVFNRHLDLGYSPEDAQGMTRFVTSLSGDPDDEDEIDIRELNLSQIKKLFLMGTLTYKNAVDRVNDNGYDLATSTVLVDSWDAEEDISRRNDLINRMVKKAIREDLSVSEVDVLFSSINLTDEEKSRMELIIDLEQREYDSIPSKTELKKMVESDIISMNKWYTMMRRHGYSDEIIDDYQKLYGLTNG